MNTSTVCYFRNGLGNFILMTPALQALASLEESGKIDICIDAEWDDCRRESLVQIIKALPFVDKMINYPKEPLRMDYKTWFWTRHTYPSPAMNIFRQKAEQFDIGVEWVHSAQHEIDFYMNLVRRRCDYNGETPKQFFPIADNPVLPDDKPNIILCNGSYGLLAGSKQWHYFKELAIVARNYFDANIIKVGYQEELKDVDSDIDYVNKLDILQTSKVIKQASIFITTDTCNMHVADALNVPMVVIWGGSLLTKNTPVNNNFKIVKTNLSCQPCHETGKYGACVGYKCLAELSVNDVMKAMRDMYGN